MRRVLPPTLRALKTIHRGTNQILLVRATLRVRRTIPRGQKCMLHDRTTLLGRRMRLAQRTIADRK